MKLYFSLFKNLAVITGCILFSTEVLLPQDTGSNNMQEKPAAFSKFIPDISLNADFSGAYRDLKQPTYDVLALPGYTVSGDNQGTLNQKSGFNFNYAELTLYSAVDPFFDLFTAFHLTEATFEIEEAYVRTLSLPFNIQLKAGKFFSSFGRLNEQHPHSWDFSDQPLVYFSFLGAEHLKEKGAQLTWLAPVSFYLMGGAEVLTGDNPMSFGVNGFSDPAAKHIVENGLFPELYIGYIKSSFDIENLVILLGVSGAQGSKRIDFGITNQDGYAVYGISRLLAADLTVKWLIDSYRYLSWQSEFLYRNTIGDEYFSSGTTAKLVQNQSGFYSQIVFRFAQQWKAGIRYDLMQMNNVTANSQKNNLPENLPRYTVMIEFSPSEFSSFRLQYNHDRSMYNGLSPVVNNQVTMDANFNIGTHGAHKF
ncbi:MAG: hypothetical protein OEV78_01640 [Spirochaetia bacterium]|nr:hypothetical protein [Spirochaetia bacterium]